jgi:hypothetical protein
LGSAPVKKKLEDEEEDGHANDPALKRTGKFAGGLIADIKRKLPWFKSDFTDALNLQCIATFCFMYFALLAPIVTFGGLLEEATHQRMVRERISGKERHICSGGNGKPREWRNLRRNIPYIQWTATHCYR